MKIAERPTGKPLASRRDDREGAQLSKGAIRAARDIREALRIAESLGELVRVRREVDPLIEVPAVLRAAAGLKPIPAVLFENVRKYPGGRMVGNLFSEHRRFSLMCGFAESEEVSKFSYLAALDKPIPPVCVDSAPCHENVVFGPVAVEVYVPPTHGALKVERKYYQMAISL
jgi:3-polyprenyl-4-hydroxybenzoate decarboxylase